VYCTDIKYKAFFETQCIFVLGRPALLLLLFAITRHDLMKITLKNELAIRRKFVHLFTKNCISPSRGMHKKNNN